MATSTKSERTESIERLREWVKPGDKLFTILRHRSASGMQRVIQVVQFKEERPYYLGYNIARALGDRYSTKHEGVTCNGTGMDMGFNLVYTLGRVLFPEGFSCIGEGCRSNDHSNGDRDYTPGHVIHTDGGYALTHEWL